MPSKVVIALLVAGTLALGVVVYLRWFYQVPKSCQSGCARAPPYLNGPGCLSVIETSPSTRLKAPRAAPYGADVVQVSGGPGAWCTPSYYAFRYVDNDDGTYSEMSPWSRGVSANSPPTYPPGTTGWRYDGCESNQLSIVITDPLDSLPPNVNGYTLNVHRQDETLDPSSSGKIVGMFIVEPFGQGIVQAWFIDVNPPSGGSDSSCC